MIELVLEGMCMLITIDICILPFHFMMSVLMTLVTVLLRL